MTVQIPPLDHQNPDPASPFCDIRDIHERAGRAIMQLVALSHRIAFTTRPDGQPLATMGDLRLIRPDVLDVTDDAAPCLANIGGIAPIWAWYRFLNEDETPTQVRPDGVPAGDPGMWVLQKLPMPASCGTIRYLAHVEFCAAQVSNKDLWTRCRGKTPALFVSPMGDDGCVEKSQTKAFHKLELRYQIRVISANWRGGVTARMTPPIKDAEYGDPGTFRQIGDLRRLLIHDPLVLATVGVETTSLGAFRPLLEKSAERVIVDSTELKMIAYTHTPNTPCDIVSPWRMWVQLQDELGIDAGPPNQITGGPDAG